MYLSVTSFLQLMHFFIISFDKSLKIDSRELLVVSEIKVTFRGKLANRNKK